MIDINKQYRTRNGREVKLLMTDSSPAYSVIGAVNEGDGYWSSYRWLACGRHDLAGTSGDDLVEVKTKHVRWVNMCRGDTGSHYVGCYATREDAVFDSRLAPLGETIACIRIEFEEGEGLL